MASLNALTPAVGGLLACATLLPDALPDEHRWVASVFALAAGSACGLLLLSLDETPLVEIAESGLGERAPPGAAEVEAEAEETAPDGAASPKTPRSLPSRRSWNARKPRRWADELCSSSDTLEQTEACIRALDLVDDLARDDCVGWRVVSRQHNLVVSQRPNDLRGGPTMWRLQARDLDCVPKALAKVMQAEASHPSWNPTLEGYDVLREDETGSEWPDAFGRSTRVTKTTAASECGGLVSSRDFTNLKRTEKRGKRYLVGGLGLEDPEAWPPVSGAIRGRNGHCGWVFAPGTNRNTTDVTWVINSDLSGWLSRGLIDSAISTVMIKFAKACRARVSAMTPAERLARSPPGGRSSGKSNT